LFHIRRGIETIKIVVKHGLTVRLAAPYQVDYRDMGSGGQVRQEALGDQDNALKQVTGIEQVLCQIELAIVLGMGAKVKFGQEFSH
jgi:hypothetical protein